ncbi:DUF6053 domain-containing protein [Lysobacter enzymogenes]|uniref:DUF6053 domain-containing protein n=1 Tax=Lysobacter enzymogenes TaxID=69 RepID=UPI003D18B820
MGEACRKTGLRKAWGARRLAQSRGEGECGGGIGPHRAATGAAAAVFSPTSAAVRRPASALDGRCPGPGAWWERSSSSALVGGASAPTLLCRIAGIRAESIGAEAPPTKA